MRRLTIALFIVCVATTGTAVASGFSIFEQSAEASGQAGAWVARAGDAGANWYNPAALARQQGMQIQFGTTWIPIGDDSDLVLDPALGGARFSAVGHDAFPSHLYFSQRVNERVAWGVGLNAPYGLVTEWTDQPVTLSARRSELTAFVLNPNVAFNLDDRWSVAVGLDYLYADVPEFSRDLAQADLVGLYLGLGQAGLPTFQTGLAPGDAATVGRSNLSGDGDEWGFNLATHYRKDEWSFGLTYRSGFRVDVEGRVEFTGIVDDFLTGGLSLFPDGPGSAEVDLPAQGAIGLAYLGAEDWEFEFDVSWAQWSTFEDLALDFRAETFVTDTRGSVVFFDASSGQVDPGAPLLNPDFTPRVPVAGEVAFPIPVVEDIFLVEDWDDTFAFRFGAAHRIRERHEVRFGLIYDEAPVPSETVRPSIPDGDRTVVSVGWGFLGDKWKIDAYYMPVWFDDQVAVAGEDGVLPGVYESFTQLLGVTFNLRL